MQYELNFPFPYHYWPPLVSSKDCDDFGNIKDGLLSLLNVTVSKATFLLNGIIVDSKLLNREIKCQLVGIGCQQIYFCLHWPNKKLYYKILIKH